jgi:broad specificity phosphatase PhoE
MALITLIRHGESIWNGERRIQGNQDPPLSARGRRQAALLVLRLQRHGAKPAAVYTSPLRRAAETAEQIAAAFGVPLVRDSALCEMRLGQWEGMTVPEIQAAYPGTYERWLADPLASPAPAGEHLDAFFARVRECLQRMQHAHPDGNLCVVSHGGVVKAVLCHVLGLEPRALFRIKQDNTAVSQVELAEAVRRVLLVNDTCHLTQAADLVPRDVLTDANQDTPTF